MYLGILWEWNQIKRSSWLCGIHDLKRTETGAPVGGVIVGKLGLAQLLVPTIGMVANEASQQVAKGTVDYLGLSIGLGMIGTTEVELGVHHSP